MLDDAVAIQVLGTVLRNAQHNTKPLEGLAVGASRWR